MDRVTVRLATFSRAFCSASRRAAYPPLFGRSTASHVGTYGLSRRRQAVLLVAPAGVLARFREGARAALKVKDGYKSQTNMLQNNGLQCRSGLRIHFVSARTGHLGAGKDGCAPPINLAVPTS